MDNLDKIKYKHSVSGWIKKIDVKTGQVMTEFNPEKREGLKKEMEAWLKIKGNEIEPQYTEEELSEKEQKEKEQALVNQKAACVQNLKATDYTLLDDHEYQEDVPKIKVLRLEWKRIIKSDEIETVPKKPFE